MRRVSISGAVSLSKYLAIDEKMAIKKEFGSFLTCSYATLTSERAERRNEFIRSDSPNSIVPLFRECVHVERHNIAYLMTS